MDQTNITTENMISDFFNILVSTEFIPQKMKVITGVFYIKENRLRVGKVTKGKFDHFFNSQNVLDLTNEYMDSFIDCGRKVNRFSNFRTYVIRYIIKTKTVEIHQNKIGNTGFKHTKLFEID